MVFGKYTSQDFANYTSLVFGKCTSLVFGNYTSFVFGKYTSIVFGNYTSLVLGKYTSIVSELTRHTRTFGNARKSSVFSVTRNKLFWKLSTPIDSLQPSDPNQEENLLYFSKHQRCQQSHVTMYTRKNSTFSNRICSEIFDMRRGTWIRRNT